MKENINEETKKGVVEFRDLNISNKLYFGSILLNHLENGLINDGNYSDSDEAYENDKLVLESSDIKLSNPMELATKLLLVGANLEGITLNPNGMDIEPYIKDMSKINQVLSTFYKLNIKDKIDFIIEIVYDISILSEVKIIDFDFNGLIDNLLTYSRLTFGNNNSTSLEL